MYQIRYKATSNGAYTTLTLFPGPTEVEYPERRSFKMQMTQDGAPVVQRPLRDGRVRRWVWKRYRPSVATYENQWATLLTLEYRHRLQNNLHPVVEIWEDTTPEGGFARMSGATKVWTKVRFLRVDRISAKGGGRITYDDSFIEFVIDDPTYQGF